MRVCFISFEYPPNTLGGAGAYAESLVKGLKGRGADVFTITRGDGHTSDQKIYRVPTSDVPYWRRIFFMKTAIGLFHKLNKLWRFDLVHFNEPHVILERPGLPTVCTLHSTQVNEIKTKLADLETLNTVVDIKDLILKSPVGSICDIFTAHSADKIISPSAHLARLIKSYCFVDERKICVVPNGIDLKAFDKIKDCDTDILSRYNLEVDNYVLFIGRLSVLKGVQYLIKAFQGIKKECANLKLVIVGTGDLEGYLRNLAHGIKNIVFTGHVDSSKIKKILYDNCVAVVVPSLYEAFPMVVLEAMACSKPVIASDVGDVPLLIKHRKNGFLVKPKDAYTIRKFIEILYENPDLKKNMGLSNRRLIEKEFVVDKMVSKTLKVYTSLL